MNEKRKTILAVANGGGHVLELLRLYPAYEDGNIIFMTANESYVKGYAYSGFLKINDYSRWNKFGIMGQALVIVWRILKIRPDVIISTGAAAGMLSILAGKTLVRSRTIWIDTLASSEKLSMSGRLVAKWADLYLTQWEQLAVEGGPKFAGGSAMILVTVGTQAPFDRLIGAVDSWAEGRKTEIVYQIGKGAYLPRNGTWKRFLDHSEMMGLFSRAELLVAHAGIGTIIKGLESGKKIIIMPRRGHLGEHRDDHQWDTARSFEMKKLVHIAMDEEGLCVAMEKALASPPPEPIGRFAEKRLLDTVKSFIRGP